MKKLWLLLFGLAASLPLSAAVSFNNFDTNWFNTANSRINFRTNSTQKFWFVTNAFSLSGSTTKFIRADGTEATPSGSGGGTVGSMINTGANAVGNVPRASDTSPTNYMPSSLTVDASGNIAAPGASSFGSETVTNFSALNGAVAFGGTLSPAQITSDQNNYAPAGLTNTYALRLTTDANRALTGIQTDGINGRTLAIWNANAVFNITFTDDDAGSTATNRFYLPLSLPVTIRPKEGMILRWSSADSRWRTLTKPGNFVGDSGSGGTAGLVPAPAAGDAAAGKFLSAGGGYSAPGGSSGNWVASGTTNSTLPGIASLYSLTVTNNRIKASDAFYLNIYSPTLNNGFASGAGNITMTGIKSVGVGQYALNSVTSGSLNTAVGYGSLYATTTGNDNTAMGYQAMQLNTLGGLNTAVGGTALYSNTTGANNTAIGVDALTLNTTADFNTAVGIGASSKNTIGFWNTTVGSHSLLNNVAGNYNCAFGLNALFSITNGFNSGFGVYTLSSSAIGSYNTALGYAAGNQSISGDHNLFLGDNFVAPPNMTGSGNIFIGTSIGYFSRTNVDNQLIIGNLIFGTNLTSGTTLSTGRIGIGKTNITAQLDVSGSINTDTGFSMATAAPITIANGTNKRAGNAALVAGTVTVSNTTVTTNSLVFLSRKTAAGTLGAGGYVYTLSAGASFTINSVDLTGVLSTLDTSTISYLLIENP